jgi:hypothetical protein
MPTFKVSYAFVMDPSELTEAPPTVRIELPDDEPTLIQVKRAVRAAVPTRAQIGRLYITGVEREHAKGAARSSDGPTDGAD